MKHVSIALLAAPLFALAACDGGDVNADTRADVEAGVQKAADKATGSTPSGGADSGGAVDAVLSGGKDVLEDATDQVEQKKNEVEEQVSAEVEQQKTAIEQQIAGYQETLTAKQKELEGIVAKIKNLSPADLLGAEGKQLKLDSASLQKVIDGLQQQITDAKSQLSSLGG